MTINSINGANTQMGQMGINQATDSYSQNIQNQIANAQKQLQELSSHEDMPLEERMKKRQEIQKQISDLNMQLRQRQIEQRKEKQQAKGLSADEMSGGTRNAGSAKTGNKSTGLSQAGMTAMISADSSIKQAKVQGSVVTRMEGRAGVLKSEIKNSHGGNVEKKQEELADIEQKAQEAVSSQLTTLADADRTMEETSKADSETQKTADKDAKTKDAEENDPDEKESGEDIQKESTAQRPRTYVSVDIRL